VSELQQNRYDRLLRRVGNMIGAGSMVNEALTELFPMIDVEGYQGELQQIKGTTLAMGASSLTGDAAESPKIQLFNPADSGMLITVTRILATMNNTSTFRVAPARIALADAVTTAVVRDNRNVVGSLPVGLIFRVSQ